MSDVAPDLLVRLLIDQSERWNRDQSRSIESYLEEHPSLRNDETILDLISNEVYVRCSRGDKPSLADYRERFPNLAEQIEVQLQLHQSAGATKNGAFWRSNASLPERRSVSGIGLLPTIPGYELIEEIGRGGMGVVYKAKQISLRRVVALKVTHIGGNDRNSLQARIRIEAEAVARLQHTNIVQVFEVGEHDDSSYMSLELVGGGSLAQRLKGEPLTEQEAAQCVQILARAMHYAHRRGVVHRDLKPANILLTPGGTPKITDFGLARQMKDNRRLTRIGDILGTPSYMAPEQANGDAEASATADVYSLGAILYELLTGKPPFQGESAWATLLMVGYTLPEPPSRVRPGVSADLDAVCLKCLSKNPLERYVTAKALADDLERYQCGRPVRARPIGFGRQLVKWIRRSPGKIGLATAVLIAATALLAGGALAGALWQHNRAPVAASSTSDESSASFVPEKMIHDRPRQEPHKGDNERDSRQDAMRAVEAERDAARLSVMAADFERDAAKQAREEAENEKRQAGSRLELARRELYAQQLLRIAETWRADPLQARLMLQDASRCPPDLRDFAWDLLSLGCDRPRVVFPTQSKNVLTIAVSVDAKTVASAGADGTVRLWDLSGVELKNLTEHKGRVNAVKFAPNGKQFATGGADKVVRVWDRSGKLLHTLTGHKAAIQALAYVPDGKTLASADDNGNIHLWETGAGKEKSSFHAHTGAIHSLVFSLDGKTLLSAGNDAVIKGWIEKKASQIGFLVGHTGPIYSMALSPDGTMLASAGADGFPRLWNVESVPYSVKHIFSGRMGRVNSVAFSSDGKVLACGTDGGAAIEDPPPAVQLWETATGQHLATIPGQVSVHSLAFLSDGKRLAVAAGHAVEVWRVTWSLETATLRNHASPLTAIAIAPDGRVLASGGRDHLIELTDVETGSTRRTLKGHTGPVTTLAFIPGARVLASGSADGSLRLWDTADGKQKNNLEAHQNGVNCIATSRDGDFLASGGQDNLVNLWNSQTGDLVKSMAGHKAPVTSLAVSRDGKILASGSSDGTLRLWNPSTGEVIQSTSISGDGIRSIVFFEDGVTVAIACQDGIIRLMDLTSGKVNRDLPARDGPVLSLALSPDGKTLVAAGSNKTGAPQPRGEVCLWDPIAGQLRAVLTGHAQAVTAVAFSTDGHRMASASLDATMKVWHTAGR